MNSSQERFYEPIVEFELFPNKFEISNENYDESQIGPVEVSTCENGVKECGEKFLVISLSNAFLLGQFEQ
jgi:hypothetical protein